MIIDDLNGLKARYNVDPSDRNKEIVRLQKKYNLYKDETVRYQFKENELEMFIKEKRPFSYLFSPDKTDDEYKSIIEGLLGDENPDLKYLFEYSNNLPDNIKKMVASLFKRANSCKEKMFKQLDKNKIDSDEKSERLTEIYIDQMGDSIQKILELSMLKSEQEWKEIGRQIKGYLSNSGFFVPEDIGNNVKNNVKSGYISIKNSHTKSTYDKTKHGEIDHFNCLPYCIYCYDSYEEKPEMRIIYGICTYYKYKGESYE